MRRITTSPRMNDFISQSAATVNSWFVEVTDRWNLYRRAGAATTSDIPTDQWGIWKNSTNNQVRLTVNDGGTIKSANLTTNPNIPAADVTLSANQAINSGVSTKINFNTETFDTDSYYDPVTFKYTPLIAGYYSCTAQVNIDLTAFAGVALTSVAIYKNGALYVENFLLDSSVGGSYMPLVSRLIQMNGTTDFLEVYAFQNSGAARNVVSNQDSFFSVHLVRAT